ncbi:sugar kinase [Pontibacter akesuensis]|uniref:2-dehydro-3-deoxygluconokinase n=1 Tax=Pontibacter akesuensis TaxID=388950 RepID=A0A1I7K5W0_9BACT|nr:sugar kinase [Pontibacter akesuensis]GHA74816.1 2-dehydro-3-deoxygluconokinase [Pontibacter akesuensis]SFU92837.1 2-dehydro-3-deoxygluconokinase [Pontibacter akesuensis]
MGKVLSFGELLLRICPDEGGQWLQENNLPFYVGGAEANVATALALWNVPSAYITALPDNFISEQLVGYLKGRKVETDAIVYQGDRVGLYYLPKGKDLKNTGVIYDRAGSAYADLKPGTIDWNKAFEGVSWFHFSAICPAINQNVADVCEEALKAAKERNIFISLDLNYRAKLWKYGKDPVEVMPALANYCDLIMGNIWAANKMLGIKLNEELIADGEKESLLQHAQLTSEEITKKFPNCSIVANTFRFDHKEGIRYYTTLYKDSELTVSQEYVAEKILDKVGSGDCFMAGLIYGFHNKLSPSDTLAFATAAAFKKLFIPSDATSTTVAEVQETISNYAN